MKKNLKTAIAAILSLTVIFFASCQAASAYDIAVKNGFSGTEQQWLDSLKGRDGVDGKDGENAPITADSLYQSAVDRGYAGTYLEFVRDYVGADLTSGDSESAINSAVFSVVKIVSKFKSSSSGGAGVIYRMDKEAGEAYIITNYHVVYNKNQTENNGISSNINVYLYGYELSNYAVKANYVGGSLNYDIAVLHVSNELITKSNAKVASIADSNYSPVGSTAIAIGNPDGRGIAATSGIISVDSEYITLLGADDATKVTIRCVRVDCAVNFGNSGGGLFNADGKLIGIVNAKITDSNVENIGYAIPSTLAVNVADNILWNCKGTTNVGVFKGLMGVELYIADSKAIYNEQEKRAEIVETVSVSKVINASAADGSLEVDDVIVSITDNTSGKALEAKRKYMVIDFMLTVRTGDSITVKIYRGTKEMEYTFTLQTENFVSIL